VLFVENVSRGDTLKDTTLSYKMKRVRDLGLSFLMILLQLLIMSLIGMILSYLSLKIRHFTNRLWILIVSFMLHQMEIGLSLINA